MKQVIHIEKDDLNAIILSRDAFNGVAVQVVRLTKSLRPNHRNEMEEHSTTVVVTQEVIPVRDQKTNKLYEDFKVKVNEAISRARQTYAMIKQNDEYIEGVFTDYVSRQQG